MRAIAVQPDHTHAPHRLRPKPRNRTLRYVSHSQFAYLASEKGQNINHLSQQCCPHVPCMEKRYTSTLCVVPTAAKAAPYQDRTGDLRVTSLFDLKGGLHMSTAL